MSDGDGCAIGCVIVIIKLLALGLLAYGAFLLLCACLWLLPYIIILVIVGLICKGIASLF